jgi:archaellum component FlaC
MDDKELDAEIERLKRVSNGLRESMETLQKGLDGTKKSKEQLVKLGKAAEAQIKVYHNLSAELEHLRDAVKNETDEKKKAILEEKRQALELQNAREKAEEGFRQGLGKMTGSVLKGITDTFMGGVKSALSGSDGLSVAADFMKGGFDIANTAAQSGSQALKDFGSATAGAGGRIGKFGVAASIAGTAISMLSSGVTELAKAGIGFMLTQTQKLMGDFVQMSQAGAIFSGGMTAMAGTALKGGMTLDQFSKVVSANRAELTSLGMGMGDASKRMAGAMGAGGTAMRKGLFALGMTVEEQADTVAKTMAIMSGPAQRLKANDAEVAKQTEDYAKNLKLLAALTGEDMKAKADAIRKENDTLAFQQKLNEMGETERLELQKAMEGMTESQRRALRENMIYGTVISKDIAISQATNSGVAKTNQEFAEAQRAGVLSAERARDIQAKNADETYKQAMGNKALAAAAMAGNQAASEAAKSQLSDAQYQRKLSQAATAEERKKIEEQYKAGKEGKDTGANLMEIQQDFAVKMQQIALKNLPAFATALQKTITDIEKAVLAVADMAGKAAGLPAWLAPLIGIGTALLQLIPLLLAGRNANTAGTVAGAAKGAAGGMGSAAGGLGGAGGAAGGGGGPGGFLQGLAKGVSAFATPQAALGLGAVTLAIMGLAKAFEIASPGFESFGKMISTVFTSVFEGMATTVPPIAAAVATAIGSFGDTLVTVFKGIGDTVLVVAGGLTKTMTSFVNGVDPVKLLGIAGGVAALGAAFIPFAVGGALAGAFAKGGGFNQVLSDLTAFASLDPVKLNQVADATKKITDSLPSAAQMVALAATGYLSKLTGGTPSGAGGNTPGAAAPSTSGSASTPSPASAANNSTAGGNDAISVMREVRDAARSQLSILERTVRAAEETLAVNKKILSAAH